MKPFDAMKSHIFVPWNSEFNDDYEQNPENRISNQDKIVSERTKRLMAKYRTEPIREDSLNDKNSSQNFRQS